MEESSQKILIQDRNGADLYYRFGLQIVDQSQNIVERKVYIRFELQYINNYDCGRFKLCEIRCIYEKWPLINQNRFEFCLKFLSRSAVKCYFDLEFFYCFWKYTQTEFR